MAKIVLVSPHVTVTTWQLALALKAQQHEVVLLTSYGENVENTHGIEFMAYFKRWSFLEGLRIIPGLFGLHTQILHLLLDEDKLNPAQAVLATFAKSHPNCILTTSLLHIRKSLGRRNPVRYLIEESDIITFPTVETLGELRGLSIRSRRQGRGILPPVLNLQDEQKESALEISEGEQKISAYVETQKFVLIPFQEKTFDPDANYFLRLKILSQRYTVLLWGSHAHWSFRARKQFEVWMAQSHQPANWLVTGEISVSLLHQLLQKSESLILAGLPLTPVELTDYFLKAIQNSCTLILDSTQASVHRTLWRNGINCWILNYHKINFELSQLLEKPKVKVSEGISEHIAQERHWLDHPMNELNRLYSRALQGLR